ncbi:Uncharacterised protein [Klebsiella michiganensis]|uniref:Uncharacterized protein n=1 Tax=Klebsiella michiganensis TaxID=1134687 RepID=A0A7H4M280_9ENTR|nr:Uncharacterised protein [Klebsiella michiganensis]
MIRGIDAQQLDIKLQRRVGKQSQKLILSLNFLRHQIKDEHPSAGGFPESSRELSSSQRRFITQEIDGR